MLLGRPDARPRGPALSQNAHPHSLYMCVRNTQVLSRNRRTWMACSSEQPSNLAMHAWRTHKRNYYKYILSYHTCVHTCMHMHTHTYTLARMRIHACMHEAVKLAYKPADIHVWTHTYMSTRAYVHTFACTFRLGSIPRLGIYFSAPKPWLACC